MLSEVSIAIFKKEPHENPFWLGLHSFVNAPVTGSNLTAHAGYEKRGFMIQVLKILLAYPHNYKPLLEQGILATLVTAHRDGLVDLLDQISVMTTLTNRLFNRALREMNWSLRLSAAQCVLRLLRLSVDMVNIEECPKVIEDLEGIAANLDADASATQMVCKQSLGDAVEILSADLTKFTQSFMHQVKMIQLQEQAAESQLSTQLSSQQVLAEAEERWAARARDS